VAENFSEDDNVPGFGDNSDVLRKYFHAEYYRSHSNAPDTDDIDELVNHYVSYGADAGLDPAPWFNTEYYLQVNVDVANAGVEPFSHFVEYGHLEGRSCLPGFANLSLSELVELDLRDIKSAKKCKLKKQRDKELKSDFQVFLDNCLEDSKPQEDDVAPVVSVIVPNFNHEEFLAERLDSILYQSFESIEVIVLDDASSDNSDEVIRRYEKKYPDKIQYVKNISNSGNVFKQWRKGIDLCRGNFIWICESDDSAETDFLEKVVPQFDDLAVMIAFCKVQFIDKESIELDGLDAYRERAESNVWGSNRSGPAAAWFSGSFSVHNIIPNVGGCLIRRQHIEDSVWETAQEFDILGDWFLYLCLSRGGKIAYVSSATTYFRQHGRNTSVKSFRGTSYYEEHEKLATNVKQHWNITDDTTWRFYKQLNSQYDSIHDDSGKLLEYLSLDKILSSSRCKEHVLIGFLGFHVGGGEYFPIFMANALANKKINVSLLALDTSSISKDMYDLLDSRVPVYSAADVRGLGSQEFIAQTGVTLINSHHIGVEGLFFLEQSESLDIPYVATLHGTYEVSGIDEYYMTKIVRNVDHWMYTADKNVNHLEKRSWATAERSKLANATPIDFNPFHLSRKLLEIDDGTFIFVLVSRPVKEKGWEDAIRSFIDLRAEELDIALLLVGEGEYQEELAEEHEDVKGLYFLGYQQNIHGLMRMSDCCLLPTRFPGESYPLILIQALQNSLPCISTDIGEIPNILINDGKSAGSIIEHDNDELFQESLTEAMRSVLDEVDYNSMKDIASKIGESYSIDILADDYIEIFDYLLKPVDKETSVSSDSKALSA